MSNTVFQQYPILFVTGTDTEVGKTFVSCKLIKSAKKQKRVVFPFKPISAGTGEYTVNGKSQIVNEDAFKLWQASDGNFELEDINPIVFDEPIAPHIAAKRSLRCLSFDLLDHHWQQTQNAIQHQVDNILVEGAGGWLLPLNDDELLSDWVAQQKLPVLLVVGIRLGCLNHAMLTAQAITASGCKLAGWVANFVEPETQVARENVNFLNQKLKKLYGIDCVMEVGFDSTHN